MDVGEYVEAKVNVENRSPREVLEEASTSLELLSEEFMGYQNRMTRDNRDRIKMALGRALIWLMVFGETLEIDPNDSTYRFVEEHGYDL